MEERREKGRRARATGDRHRGPHVVVNTEISRRLLSSSPLVVATPEKIGRLSSAPLDETVVAARNSGDSIRRHEGAR